MNVTSPRVNLTKSDSTLRARSRARVLCVMPQAKVSTLVYSVFFHGKVRASVRDPDYYAKQSSTPQLVIESLVVLRLCPDETPMDSLHTNIV